MACTGSEYEQGTVRVRRFLNEWKISLLKITLSGEERNLGKWESGKGSRETCCGHMVHN